LRLTTAVDIDIISLFLYGAVWHPYNDTAIADIITEAVKDFTHTGESLRVISPTDTVTGWFTIFWAGNIRMSPKHYIKRVNTEEELIALVGHRPVEILKLLDSKELLLGQD